MNIRNVARSGKAGVCTPLNIEEELHAEEAASAVVSKEIDHFYQQNLCNVTVLSDFLRASVFGSDDLVASSREVEAIIEYVVGNRSAWCSNSVEVKEFRRVIEQSFKDEWDEFRVVNFGIPEHMALRSLPETFILPPLQKSELEMLLHTSPNQTICGLGLVSMLLWYTDVAGIMCSTMKEFPFDTVADDAISVAINEFMPSAHIAAKKDCTGVIFVFRVKDRNEYIYGNERLINFWFIRDSISDRKDINIVIEPLDESNLVAPLFRPSYISQAQPNRQHKELSGRSSALEMSVWDVHDDLSIRIIGGFENLALTEERKKEENLRDVDHLFLAVAVGAYFGTTECCPPQMTTWKVSKNFVSSGSQTLLPRIIWDEDEGIVTLNLPLSHAPRELKLCFTLLACPGERFDAVREQSATKLFSCMEDAARKGDEQSHGSIFVLGVASVQLYDYAAHMRTGAMSIRMWNSNIRAGPIGCSSSNPDSNACVLHFVFPTFAKPVVFPSGRPPTWLMNEAKISFDVREARMNKDLAGNEIEQLRQLKRVLCFDPLTSLSFDDKIIVWKYREVLVNQPRAMAKFLLSVDWMQPFDAYEARCFIRQWAPLPPFSALELLDADYADTVVRELAIGFLAEMSDHDLRGCILQLVQVLKYEPYHYSALARFLLRRTFRSSHVIGHYAFWYLAAEVKNPTICERHGLLLEEILKRSPLRRKLLRQVYVSRELLLCALKVQRAQKKDRVKCLRDNLALIRLPPHFTLALNPSMECSMLEINECKVMDSKKFPLWLVFRNHLNPDSKYFVIFKSGDDLRQDLLTLQLLALMDSTWKTNGLDLRIIPYGCISTGEGVGMIEVVLNSDTVANITRKEGGAQAAFNDEPLLNYLRVYSRERVDVEKCLWNFVFSVAGYTVATYILGIGDRHNDNIMLKQDGTLFHIDFGHFLGNFKTKFGFKRETAPFVFTPMYLHMMGGASSPIFQYYMDLACRAYNVIRRCSSVLIMLFMLMLSTGIPELQTKEDMEWLRTVLLLNRSDEEAAEHFKSLVSIALNNIRTLINDYIHIMAH